MHATDNCVILDAAYSLLDANLYCLLQWNE